MDPPGELRRSFSGRRSGSSRRQGLRKSSLSITRLGTICPFSIRDSVEPETRERAWSWLCVIPRDSRTCRMRCPIFSTIAWFGHFWKSCRSSPRSSRNSGGGIRNSVFGVSRRRHRRQFPAWVRYCTSPQVLQRITSRSMSASNPNTPLMKVGNPLCNALSSLSGWPRARLSRRSRPPRQHVQPE